MLLQLESAFEFNAIKSIVSAIVALFPQESSAICAVDAHGPLPPSDLLALVCLRKAKAMRTSRFTEGSLQLLEAAIAEACTQETVELSPDDKIFISL